MALTDTAIRALKPHKRPYKVADGTGLYLLVTPAGSRLWKLKFRNGGGREKKLSFGAYPEVSLKEARKQRDEARKIAAEGIDPAEKRKRDRHAAKVNAANSFQAVARAYIDKRGREGVSPSTLSKLNWILRQIERRIGARPVAEIQPFEILEAVRRIEASGRCESAHRALQFSSQVFRYAVACQFAHSDPTRDLRGALTGHKAKNHAAILEPAKVAELLRAIDGYEGGLVTRAAMQLSAILFVRPGELRHAEWSEFDFEAKIWRIPADKMKARLEHVVPLPRQALELFEGLRRVTGDGRYVFPSVRSGARAMSENTVNAALRRLGYTKDEMTAHGFRAMASTLLNESGMWSPDAIERALAHQGKDAVRAAYHRGQHWNERVEMAQWWADYLDRLRTGAQVVPIDRARAG